VFLPYANHVVLVSQMSAVDREVHSLHRARNFVEVLKTSGWRTLRKLDLGNLYIIIITRQKLSGSFGCVTQCMNNLVNGRGGVADVK